MVTTSAIAGGAIGILLLCAVVSWWIVCSQRPQQATRLLKEIEVIQKSHEPTGGGPRGAATGQLDKDGMMVARQMVGASI